MFLTEFLKLNIQNFFSSSIFTGWKGQFNNVFKDAFVLQEVDMRTSILGMESAALVRERKMQIYLFHV